jgi:hypothetical protein
LIPQTLLKLSIDEVLIATQKFWKGKTSGDKTDLIAEAAKISQAAAPYDGGLRIQHGVEIIEGQKKRPTI